MTTTFNTATPFVDIRALEYSGLDPVNPFDVGTSASGTGTSANSGTVTTTAAGALIFGAGITTGGFSAAGTNFTTRIITTPDGDIAEDRIVTAAGAYSATAPVSGCLGHAGRRLQSCVRIDSVRASTLLVLGQPTGPLPPKRLGDRRRHRGALRRSPVRDPFGVNTFPAAAVHHPAAGVAASLAQARGYDIDKPRNLAKSVTVE